MSSCEKPQDIKYEVPIEVDFVIGGGLNTIETHYFTIRNIRTLFEDAASTNNVDPQTIKNIIAYRAIMTTRFNDESLDFIQDIAVYAVSKKDPNVKREMYYLEFVPFETNTELNLLSSTTSLKEILQEETIDIEVRINIRRFFSRDIGARINFSYAVF